MSEPIYLELSSKWAFACSVEWPGWTRHAKAAGDPIAELLEIAPRYANVLAAAGVDFSASMELEVVDELEGDSGTEWGVPSIVPAADYRPISEPEADRLVGILQAAWAAYDEAVDGADGFMLRKGPRGGGRQLPALIDHCLEADKVYLSKLGSRRSKLPGDADWRAVEADIRQRAVEAFRDRAAGRDVREPSRTAQRWEPRWYVRYVAWHTLVHTWEIQDRLTEEPR